MTISSTDDPRAGPFNGNGSQTAFPFEFKAFSKEDLLVVRTDEDGLEYTLVLDSDYSVTLNADQNADPGGSVTYPISGDELPVGETLTIASNLDYTQETDITNGGGFYPQVIEDALDRAVMLIKQVGEKVNRSLRLALSTPDDVDATLPVPEAQKIIGWNDTATGLVNRDITDFATVVAFAAWQSQTFDGDGVTTQFTLSSDPGNINNLDIAISGVTQTPAVDFTLSGTTLTFLTAPPAGADNVFVRWGQALPQGTSQADQVTYTPAGVGAVDRTVEDRLDESTSVLDFMSDALRAQVASGTPTSDMTLAFTRALALGKRVRVPAGTYLANITPSQLFNIEGDGMTLTILRPFDSSLPAVKNMTNPGGANFWRRSRIANLSIRQTGNVGDGFTFGDPALYTVGDEQIGRVDFDSIEITGFNKAVFKTCGNIGNTFRNCRVQNNNYNYYAQSSDYGSGSAPAMHAGLDLFDGGAWGYAGLANIFIRDRIGGKGGWTFTNDVDLEGSTGHNIVYLASTTDFGYVPDLIVDTSWLEANATGGSITIDGLTGTITGLPYDFYLSGARHVVVKNGFIGKVNLLNGSNMVAEKCGTDSVTAGVFSLTKDASSTFLWDGATSITGLPGQLNTGPWSHVNRSTISETPVYNVPGFNKFEVAKDVTVLAGFSFGAVKFPGTVVVDGMSADRCGEFAVSSGSPVDIVPAVTTVAGRYYAVSIQIRLASGTNGSVTVGNLAAGLTVDHSEWRQYVFVKAATTTPATITLSASSGISTMRVGHCQIVEFTTADAALAYLLRGRMAINSDARSALLPLSAFTDANGGAGASFNSAVISQTIPGTAVTLCEVNLRNTTLAKVQVDMLLAIDDQTTGAALTQPVGFSSVTFATTASTPSLVLGACTVTFSLVNTSGTVWELRASQTGSVAGLAAAGLAFIKGH